MHELQVVTVGGIVPPGALIAQIIPADTARAFEFRVAPTAVDNIQPSQAVRLRFAAFIPTYSGGCVRATGGLRAIAPMGHTMVGQSIVRAMCVAQRRDCGRRVSVRQSRLDSWFWSRTAHNGLMLFIAAALCHHELPSHD